MSKRMYIYMLFLCSVILQACSKDHEQVKQIVYDLPNSVELQNPIGLVEDGTDGHVYEVKGEEDVGDIPMMKDSIMEKESSHFNIIEEFTGVSSTEVNPISGNLSILLHENMESRGVVCPDPQSDIIYYVNYSNDNYIYALEGDKSTLVIDRAATNLYLHNNELYFIGSNDNSMNVKDFRKAKNNGIYKFNIESKEVTCLVENYVLGLYVNTAGVYYSILDGLEASVYNMDFNNQTRKLDTFFLSPYKEYVFNASQFDFYMFNKVTGEQITLLTGMDDLGSIKYGIQEDILYCVSEDFIYSINLITGEKSVYNLNLFDHTPGRYINSVALYDGKMYIATGGTSLIRIDLNGENLFSIPCLPTGNTLSELYVVGNRLFALSKLSQGTGSEYKLFEIIKTDDSYRGLSSTEVLP